MTRASANVLLLGIALVWGLAFIYQKTAMAHVGPLAFVAARSAIACLALLPLAWLEGRRVSRPLAPFDLWPVAALGGVMFFLGAVLQQIGLVTATVTNTGFLTGLYVVITPWLVWMFFRTRPAGYVWGAAALAFTGTWLLGGGTLAGFSHGDVLVAISALFWAAHMLVVERSGVHGRPIAFTTLQFAVTGLIALAGAAAFEANTLDGLLAAAPELIFVGLLSSALTFTLLAVAMKHTPAPEAAILVSMETVFAALFAAFMLDERLSVIGWCGATLMFTASMIIHAAPIFRRTRPPRPIDNKTSF